MAALMTAPMVVIELVVMRSMYKSTRMNVAIYAASFLLLVGAWAGIRQQVLVGDTQFLKSMIPHHSGAILMCREASIQDAEIRKLCQQIIKSQREEIAQMNAILQRQDKTAARK